MKPHDAHIADDCLAPQSQAWIGLGHLPAGELRSIPDNGDTLRRNATTLYLHLFVRLIRGDDVVGEAQGELLQHKEYAGHQAIASIGVHSAIQLRDQVVVVVHKALAQEFEGCRDKHEGVRRVGGMNDVKAFAEVDEQGQDEQCHRRIAILEQVADEPARLRRRWVPVDVHPVDGLTPALSRPRRGDHGDLISGIGQRSGLVAHTGVLGVGVILHQHEHAPTSGGVHCARISLYGLIHLRIMRCTVWRHFDRPPDRIRRASTLTGLAQRDRM